MNDIRKQKILQYIKSDPFVKFLGAEVEILQPGHSRATISITDSMVNFHGITHGGVIFALGDMAFAAASNSYGQEAVALNVGINFLKATGPGDRLAAEAKEQNAAGPTALYDIIITDQTGEIVARSQDLVYRKKNWFVAQED